MTISISYDTLYVDSESFTRAVREYIEQQMRIAAGKFAAAALVRIPIRTGFVASAIGVLAELLGSNANFNPIVAHARQQIRAGASGRSVTGISNFASAEYYYPGAGIKIAKTPENAKQFATPPANIIKTEGLKVSFNFEVDITYFRINDNVAGHAPSAPWGAFKAGEQAFLDYMNTTAVQGMPKIIDYIIKKRVTR